MVNSILEGGETVWTNGLNSEMKLTADGLGNLTGTYDTAVGASEGPQPLCGKYNPGEECPSLGWVVQWKPRPDSSDPKCKGWSTTAWSGQLLKKSDGTYIIEATWLLTKQTRLNQSWKDTLIGCGLFTQVISS